VQIPQRNFETEPDGRPPNKLLEQRRLRGVI
jgi:hypothetical protein